MRAVMLLVQPNLLTYVGLCTPSNQSSPGPLHRVLYIFQSCLRWLVKVLKFLIRMVLGVTADSQTSRQVSSITQIVTQDLTGDSEL